MTGHEIERRLRMPAHDEPANLPALLLPRDLPAPAGFDSALRLRFGGPMTVRLLTAVLLLLGVLVGAIATGALRLEQLVTPFTQPGLYSGRGVELTYPETWTRLTPLDPFGNSGASVALIVSSRDVSGCEVNDVGTLTPAPAVPTMGVSLQDEDQTGKIFGLEDRIHACVIEQPMTPGEIRVTVTATVPQAIATGPIGDFTDEFTGIPLAGVRDDLPSAATGFGERIDGMPAKLVVQPRSMVPGAEEVRTWVVAVPGNIGLLWFVQATLAGPDLEAARAEADAIARSLRFSEHLPELDPATRDAALATAIDHRDREFRSYPKSRLLGCMPRTPGEQAATVTEGPGGALTKPVEVTCSTSVAPTEVGLWRAELVASWDAGQGVDAGRWGQVVYFDASGVVLGGGAIGLADDAYEGDAFPGSVHPQPPALDGPILLPAGSLVRVLVPDLNVGVYDKPLSDESSHLPMIGGSVGTYLVILEGPVERDDLEWYLAANEHELGWMVPTADGRALVEVVEQPPCPATLDVTELGYLQALVRRLCAGTGDVTLGPVQAGRRDLQGTGFDEVTTDPAWLAAEPVWQLFGTGGADGVDPGLPVALAPSVGGTLPDGGWLTVTGHFDDPASAGCSMTIPPEWGRPPEPPEFHVLRCRDRFVVTGVERADAP